MSSRFSPATGPHRLARPRTSPFHGGNGGSNPPGDATSLGYPFLSCTIRLDIQQRLCASFQGFGWIGPSLRDAMTSRQSANRVAIGIRTALRRLEKEERHEN